MPRPNPFSRKPNDDQSPETMMFPTDDTQMMDEPVPANADDADSTIIMPRVDDPPYHPQQMPTRRPQQQQPQQQPQETQQLRRPRAASPPSPPIGGPPAAANAAHTAKCPYPIYSGPGRGI